MCPAAHSRMASPPRMSTTPQPSRGGRRVSCASRSGRGSHPRLWKSQAPRLSRGLKGGLQHTVYGGKVRDFRLTQRFGESRIDLPSLLVGRLGAFPVADGL